MTVSDASSDGLHALQMLLFNVSNFSTRFGRRIDDTVRSLSRVSDALEDIKDTSSTARKLCDFDRLRSPHRETLKHGHFFGQSWSEIALHFGDEIGHLDVYWLLKTGSTNKPFEPDENEWWKAVGSRMDSTDDPEEKLGIYAEAREEAERIVDPYFSWLKEVVAGILDGFDVHELSERIKTEWRVSGADRASQAAKLTTTADSELPAGGSAAGRNAKQHGDTPEAVDLYFFRSWGVRVQDMVDNASRPGSLTRKFFRPDSRARDAMIRFAVRYPLVIRPVQDYLDRAEQSFRILYDLLPPSDCPECGSEADFQTSDGYRDCRDCGAVTEVPAIDRRAINRAEEDVTSASDALGRIIRTAAEVIEGEYAARQPAGAETNGSLQTASTEQAAGDGAEGGEPSIIVDVDRSRITFQGETFDDIRSEQALRWLKVLTDRPGVLVSSTILARHDSELDGARTSRLKNALPEAVACHIKSEPGKGSRWNPPA